MSAKRLRRRTEPLPAVSKVPCRVKDWPSSHMTRMPSILGSRAQSSGGKDRMPAGPAAGAGGNQGSVMIASLLGRHDHDLPHTDKFQRGTCLGRELPTGLGVHFGRGQRLLNLEQGGEVVGAKRFSEGEH